MDHKKEYERWLGCVREADLLAELRTMDEAQIADAFYRDLAFGTGGLRGVLGAGTNRMNVHIVARASQGAADYVRERFPAGSVAISYDSRLKSEEFARTAACVFAANGLQVRLFDRIMPTPCLSWAVRALGCSVGVMITASHNPARYNGYKVYGPDGCQITQEAAAAILRRIESTDTFDGVRYADFDEVLAAGRITYIPEDVITDYVRTVKEQSVLFGDAADRSVSIVYTPLNGAGWQLVPRVLAESGFTGVTVVREQADPDGSFPTCPYPNPEENSALTLGLAYCERTGADLLLATDPDCDRCGAAVRDGTGYRRLTGNEVGLLLLDYVCAQRSAHGHMPKDPLFVKTIVTTDLAERIASHYGVRTENVLTGFKYIGELVGGLQDPSRFICGFEESCGYLTGPYVRDKDAVDAALMIAEMYAFYRARGISLPEKLRQLEERFGSCLYTLHSYEFPGSEGAARMARIMERFRGSVRTLGGRAVTETLDYRPGIGGLPPADVVKLTAGDASVVIRPSGTEPKIKLYISVTAADRALAEAEEARFVRDLEALMEV